MAEQYFCSGPISIIQLLSYSILTYLPLSIIQILILILLLLIKYVQGELPRVDSTANNLIILITFVTLISVYIIQLSDLSPDANISIYKNKKNRDKKFLSYLLDFYTLSNIGTIVFSLIFICGIIGLFGLHFVTPYLKNETVFRILLFSLLGLLALTNDVINKIHKLRGTHLIGVVLLYILLYCVITSEGWLKSIPKILLLFLILQLFDFSLLFGNVITNQNV